MTRNEILSIAKPILFNSDMVNAIIDGRKSVTRRVIKFPEGLIGSHVVGEAGNPNNQLGVHYACGIKRPTYKINDILYVRETWTEFPKNKYHYCADLLAMRDDIYFEAVHCPKWKPSIHMPKEAARIFLRVTDVRAERIQDITDDEIIAEGLEIGCPFDDLWNSTIKKSELDRYGWNSNPWVWVYEFERLDVT